MGTNEEKEKSLVFSGITLEEAILELSKLFNSTDVKRNIALSMALTSLNQKCVLVNSKKQ